MLDNERVECEGYDPLGECSHFFKSILRDKKPDGENRARAKRE
jgi:hypothetical protein